MKSWIITPLMVVLIAAGSYFFYISTLPPELDEGFLYGNGHIEGTEVNISAEVSGRVLKSNLLEGSTMKKGELLVELDATEQTAALAVAAAQRNALEFEQKHIVEQLQTWQDNLATADRDLVRYTALRKRGIVTVQKLDQITLVRTVALGKVRAFKAQLEQAKANVTVAAKNVELLQITIDKSKIHTPMDATILSKSIELGELATSERLIAVLVDMQDLELKAYLPEAVIGKIKLDAPAKVRVSAFSERYFNARVKRVDQRAQFTPRDINMPEERVRMVFGVVLALDNKEGFLKPGMPADAWIRWDEAKDWPQPLVIPH
ncbi:MAG: efflux RND transporter periplasmic adaptor subunit [Gammaproteobacteria bacterium]|nr:efflux RND transporter periplasmic adaptor subunit [Gammaproteobacteria bacterium]MBQ0839578.1 efflux RND transporter periplasmic adaptor subunit [Gammaproteobacteria bacterium]